jgi:hypothetical protein
MSRSSGLAQSVQTRLVPLSRSPEADRFVLRGALLLLVWLGETIRPTRDADLLAFGDLIPVTRTPAWNG